MIARESVILRPKPIAQPNQAATLQLAEVRRSDDERSEEAVRRLMTIKRGVEKREGA